MKLVRYAAVLSLMGTGCDSVGEDPGAPVFVSQPSTRARVGVPYEAGVLAVDPDGKSVGYSLDEGP